MVTLALRLAVALQSTATETPYEAYSRIARTYAAQIEKQQLEDVVESPWKRGERMAPIVANAIRDFEKANQTPWQLPKPFTWDTLMPEVRSFRQCDRAAADAVVYWMSQGQETLALRAIRVSLERNRHFRGLTTIHFLVAQVGDSAFFESIGDTIHTWSLSALEQHQRLMEIYESTAEDMEQFLNSELAATRELCDRLAKADPKTLEEAGYGELIAQKLGDMTLPERKEYLARVFELIASHFSEAKQMVHLPLKKWTQLEAPDDELGLMPVLEGVFRQGLHRIEQARMMRLRLALEAYRWRNKFYPGSLELMNDPSVTTDPLTDKPFIYETVGKWEVELKSTGTKFSGPIEFLKRTASRASDEPPVP